MTRQVTYSRNLTLSLSRSCQCVCKYCAFATRKPHLQQPDEVLSLLDGAAKTGIKELLVLTGEFPEHNPGTLKLLKDLGHESFLDYVIWACEQALERGILPHSNIGVLSKEELARLRTVTASQGLMLESSVPGLVVHQGSPTKDPLIRMQTINAAGELKIPFTSGILVGIGESESDRFEALQMLADSHAKYGHLQEVILQNYVPHRRYYGEEPAEIATEAAQEYWRTGLGSPPEHARPSWASDVDIEAMKRLIEHASQLMPDVGVQVPPNLADWWPELVAAGATDLGGLSANGDHISPEHPFPSPQQVGSKLKDQGCALSERLCVYEKYIGNEWLDQRVLKVIDERFPTFKPSGVSASASDSASSIGSSSGPATTSASNRLTSLLEASIAGDQLDFEQLEQLFASRDAGATEEIRLAADSLRQDLCGETATFIVNRNINVSNICTVGCAFCGFGQSARSKDAYTITAEDFKKKVAEAIDFGATELCIQSGIHPDWQLSDYTDWLELAHQTAAECGSKIHLHAYSPMEISHIAQVTGNSLEKVFSDLKAAGLGSTPGTAAEILDDEIRDEISPNKLPAARWLEVIEASHRAGLKSTSTVLFGHIEQPRHLARHMHRIVELQAKTGGITEFVPLSFIPFHTRLGRTKGVTELPIEDNLRLTACFRIALGHSITNLQASWVKMGIDAATEALRWGVNDLGGTLMEESISRMAGADHGIQLTPEQLIEAAHAAGRPAAQRTTVYELVESYPLAPALV